MRTTPMRRAAFTLVELLVAVAIIALLIALITGVASRAIYQQKKSITDQTMAALTRAVEQFATANPLRSLYGRKDLETFGAYPPYQLKLPGSGASKDLCAPYLMEPDPPAPGVSGTSSANLLSERLTRDFGGKSGADPTQWVMFYDDSVSGGAGAGQTIGHDDIRSLIAYMLVFDKRSLDQVSPGAFKPLVKNQTDRINARGTGFNPPAGDALPDYQDVLVPHDGWGVPLDYMLYAKYEWKGFRATSESLYPGSVGLFIKGYRVVDRKPAFRSRGVSREEYDAWIASATNKTDPATRALPLKKPENWIFSDPLPKPWAQITDQDDATHTQRDGLIKSSLGSASNGWLRVVAKNDDYAYRPDLDK